jgi:hypothetical protein
MQSIKQLERHPVLSRDCDIPERPMKFSKPMTKAECIAFILTVAVIAITAFDLRGVLL